MSYVPTRSQVPNVFEKILSKRQFDDMVSKLAINDIFMTSVGRMLEFIKINQHIINSSLWLDVNSDSALCVFITL